MTVKDYYEFAVRNEFVDLYTLIMFLVYEKKVLAFDDPQKKLMFYLQDRFADRMNQHLKEYKKKLKIQYKPCVFEVKTHKHKTVYILAYNEKQATSFAFSQLIKPVSMNICDKDTVMTLFNKKGEEINITIKDLRDKAKEIPTLLGGF